MLIARLNALAHLSPDQIVEGLQTIGFLKCHGLSEADYDRVFDKDVCFYHTSLRQWEGGRSVPGYSKRIRAGWRTYNRFQAGHWNGWWMIPVEEWNNGHRPDLPTE